MYFLQHFQIHVFKSRKQTKNSTDSVLVVPPCAIDIQHFYMITEHAYMLLPCSGSAQPEDPHGIQEEAERAAFLMLEVFLVIHKYLFHISPNPAK